MYMCPFVYLSTASREQILKRLDPTTNGLAHILIIIIIIIIIIITSNNNRTNNSGCSCG
jgi:hypothetical protein